MDSGLVERILPSIRRLQMLLIYRNGGVANPETCGHIACTVRLSEFPRCSSSRRSGCAFQPDARSPFMSKVLFSTIRVVKGLAGTGGDLRSDRVLGRETTHPFHGGHRRHDQDEVQAARSG